MLDIIEQAKKWTKEQVKVGELLYEGKAKRIFSVLGQPAIVLMEYKDSLTAFNAQKKGEFLGKGQLNCKISSLIFNKLAQHNISTHWIQTLSTNQMLVQKTKIIPLEVVIRNNVAGSLAKKLNRSEGEKLNFPLVELYYKDDALGDPFVSDDQAVVFEWANVNQLQKMKSSALEINQILKDLFLKANLTLIDFKIEFGINNYNEIILADEISPDCMRLWDTKTQEKMDKDRFRRDLGKVEEAYQEVLNRLERV